MPVATASVSIDALLLRFERAAAGNRSADIDSFLPPPGSPRRAEAVCELTRVDMETRWTRGERPTVDEYLSRYWELSEPSLLSAVAFEHYRQRLIAGEHPSADEYRQRYEVDVAAWPGPETATSRRGPTSLRSSVPNCAPADKATEVICPTNLASATVPMPEPGQTFAGFELVRELGRGGFARVFLAEQSDLARRQVAVKVSAVFAGEVRTLARLQHTNIVPVYSVHRQGTLSAVCMPYFGGTTLANVVSDLTTDIQPPSGRSIVDVVRRRRFGVPSKVVLDTLAMLEAASFIEAILWIGERLADALAHAHERGIVHQDIKPANVLLADDGQPMLLDFNLAADGNEPDKARMGGTLPYMAPEQLAAFRGPERVADPRSDIFSLGVVLFQLLARSLPYPAHEGPTEIVLTKMRADRAGPPPRLTPHLREIPSAVESIIRTCLEPDPAKRYPSAAALRDDIARQRAHQRLLFAPEPSLKERTSKWARRHPRFVSPAAIGTYAAALLLLASAAAVQLSLSSRTHRQDVERREAYRNYEEFLKQSDVVKLTAGSPTTSAEVVLLGSAALAHYRATEPGWEDRDEIVRLPDAERERLKNEIGELAFLTARATALSRRDVELAERLNSLAGTTLGAEAAGAVAAQRSDFTGLTAAQLSEAASDGSRDDLLRAHDLAARGRYAEALPAASRFVGKHPEDFGGWFLKGRCHDVLGQYEDARAAYGTCVALRPMSARAIAARGDMAFRHAKDLEQARVDLDRAVALEPHLFEARFTRALLRHRIGRDEDALVDLNALAAEPASPSRLLFVRADVRDALGDKVGAAEDRALGMKSPPADPASFVTRGLALAETDNEAALADFRAAEVLDPYYAQAMVNQAWLLGEKMNRPAEALAAADRLLRIYPDHHTGRGGRAVLLARLGRTDEAITAIRRYLADAPHPATYYQAACVFAIVSKSDPKYQDEAVRLTATALLRGFGHDYLLTDEDLDPIRGDGRFRKVAEGVRVMKDLGDNK